MNISDDSVNPLKELRFCNILYQFALYFYLFIFAK